MADIILINANPPGKAPTIVLAKPIRRLAIPPCVISCPERIKKGIAKSVKLSKPVAIRCAIVVAAGINGREIIIVSSDEIAMLHATGVPIEIKIIKLKIRTITGRFSIFNYLGISVIL
tara:strand:- start:5765 stop:6118 length:354 start_codon:yes stop_codon:yes gene_type:complete